MIKFDKVYLRYDTGISLRDLNFTADPGEFIYLFGESGCGKSSILKMIYMDLFPNSGRVEVLDFDSSHVRRRDIALVRQQIGMVFQDFKLLGDRDIYANIALPLELLGMCGDDVRRKVVSRSDDLGLRSRLTHRPHELSAGEQQRVALARAMVTSPKILLADEPTASLDDKSSGDITDYLWKINSSGTTVLFATHKGKLIKQEPARTLTIVSGEIVGDRT